MVIQEGAAKASSTNIFSTVSTPAKASSTNLVNTVSILVSTASSHERLSLSDPTNPEEDDLEIPPLEDIYQNSTDGISTTSSYNDEGVVADFTNLDIVVNVSPIPTSRIHSSHPTTLILGDPTSAVQTRSKDEGRTRDIVDEYKEIEENVLSTEDTLSTDKDKVSTDRPIVSTDGSKVSTDRHIEENDRPIVSTDGSKVSTDRHIKGTDEQVEGTEEQNEGIEEHIGGTEENLE
ncbi:hypothetical protein Tco_1308540, partial [Tanacetum coccineum]